MKIPNIQLSRTEEERNQMTLTSNQSHFTQTKSKDSPNGRRGDINNANRKMTIGFGYGAEAGISLDQTVHRNQGYYHHYFVPKKNEMNPNIAHDIAK